MAEIREVIAASVGESARFNKRHRCTRPEVPAAMCVQIAEDALAAIKQAGFVVVPAEPTEAMVEAGVKDFGGDLVTTRGASDIYRAMIEASNAPT